MNSNEVLFELKNVSCSYSSVEKSVLKVDHLIIPKGKIIFLLGASGTGKSTLLETLGLMNDTLKGGSIIFYPEGDNNNSIDYKSLWMNNSDHKISGIRKQFFSFVFQNTNLMSNFSAYENVGISGLIDDKRQRTEIVSDAVSLMEKVKLPASAVSFDTNVFNLSGGQRQRLSFVRALAKNPNVLFCDEPTGNLDEGNAREVFEIISGFKKDNFSAIIVSHDINLALRYADLICTITKSNNGSHGEILNENVFSRESWSALNPAELSVFRNKIARFFVPSDEIKTEATKSSAQKEFRLRSFNALFYLKEGKSLLGKNFVNLWILLLLLSVSLLAIGFANGSLSYLDKKMHDPFVNWVPLKIPWIRSGEKTIVTDLEIFNNENLRKQFNYSTVSLFVEERVYIQDYKTHRLVVNSETKCRSIDITKDNDLLRENILGSANFCAGDKNGFRDEKDLAVIVRQSMLEKFNYPPDAEYIFIEQTCIDSGGVKAEMFVPVPIRAVVKEIPGKNDILFTTYFYKAWNQPVDDAFDLRTKLGTAYIYLKCNNIRADEIRKYVESKFSADIQPDFSLKDHTQSYGQGYDLIIHFLPAFHTKKEKDETVDHIKKLISDKFPEVNPFEIYYYDQVNERFEDIHYDGMSVYFSKLDSVRAVNNFIIKNLNEKKSAGKIEMDESQIKEKENFNFLNNITLAVSYLIIMFGCLALSIFIFNLLRNHLQKVTMNIGTFKAMGLSNSRALRIYFVIIAVFVFSGIIFSFLFVGGLGKLINTYLSSILNVEGSVEYFRLMDIKTLWSITIFLVVSLFVSWLTIKKILSKTPGDLIYNR